MKSIPALMLAFATLQGSALAAPRPAAQAAAVVPEFETTLLKESNGLRPEVLHAALTSWDALRAQGVVDSARLSVIDYSLPSTEKRMWVFDLSAQRLLFHELVAHGRNSGWDLAETFSNDDGSYMTSLGAFVTGGTYVGGNGYSLRLRGTEPINDRAEARAIVMHGAPYVDAEIARKQGRLGRSLGCPAVRPAIARTLIDTIKGGSVLYAWHPSVSPR